MLPSLCGRDPDALDARGLSRAAVESVAENTADAVVGALFWGAVAGPAGVARYRAANTLDAMVGHRSERYAAFGWAAARLDDVAELARRAAAAPRSRRCCAPVVGGSPAATCAIVRRDGAAHPSPNAGRIEAAFAGALGVRLGGPLSLRRPRRGAPDARRPAGRPTAGGRRAGRSRLSSAVGAAAALLATAVRAAIARRRP